MAKVATNSEKPNKKHPSAPKTGQKPYLCAETTHKIMTVQNLELIETRTLFLKRGQPSSDIVLKDDIGGDMYFSLTLEYIGDNEHGKTSLDITDGHHASLTVETRPAAITRLTEPYAIGTYRDGKTLYLDFTVKPSTAGEHEVNVSFYTNKNGNGTKQER